MPRALRTKITVKWGLLQFDVKLHSAREEPEGANTVCVGTEAEPHQLTKTVAPLHCPTCNTDSWADFIKAMNVGGDEYVPLPKDFEVWSEAEMKTLTTEINLDIHDAAEVEFHTLPDAKLYYLEPQSAAAAQAYSLLVDRVMVRTDRAFVCEYAIKSVPAFYRLGVMNGSLVLKELCRPELVREPPVIVPAVLTPANIKLADEVIATTMTSFDPAAHSDRRKSMIEAYVASQTPVSLASTPEGEAAPVLDLMAAMQASIDAANAAKAPAPKPARKRAPAKKAAAKAAKSVPAARSGSRQKVG